MDTLLRIDCSKFLTFNHNNKLYFTFKTGAIYSYEKYNIYETQKETNKFEPYFDHIETLLLFEVDSFVQSIRENNSMEPCYSFIDNADLHGSIELLDVEDNNIIYISRNFDDETCMIKKYNIENKIYETFDCKNLYNKYLDLEFRPEYRKITSPAPNNTPIDFLIFNHNIYSKIRRITETAEEVTLIKDEGPCPYTMINKTNISIVVYDMVSCTKLFEYKQHKYPPNVVYIDTEIIVLQVTNESLSYDVLIYNIKTSELINKYEDRQGYFHKASNTILLYKYSI